VQSSSQITTTNKPTPSFFTGRIPFLSPNQQCQSTERKKISHSMDLLTPSSPGFFQLCLWPLTAPGYLGEGWHASQPTAASTPTFFNSFVVRWITLQVSHHQGCKTCVKNGSYKLIFRGACNSLMAWPDWLLSPTILRQIYATE